MGRTYERFSKHLRDIILYWSIQYNPIWLLFVLFLLYFCTLFPDSVLCLLQKPALDLCCVVGQLPPLLILIMTTSGNLETLWLPKDTKIWWSLYCVEHHNACHNHVCIHVYNIGLCSFLLQEILCFAKNGNSN